MNSTRRLSLQHDKPPGRDGAIQRRFFLVGLIVDGHIVDQVVAGDVLLYDNDFDFVFRLHPQIGQAGKG